jgi:hypothetical protein
MRKRFVISYACQLDWWWEKSHRNTHVHLQGDIRTSNSTNRSHSRQSLAAIPATGNEMNCATVTIILQVRVIDYQPIYFICFDCQRRDALYGKAMLLLHTIISMKVVRQYGIISWSWETPEKLTDARLIKKSFVFCGKRRVIVLTTITRHWTPSWARSLVYSIRK